MSAPLRELMVFESLIEQARKSIRDPRVTSLLMHRRKELERSLRGADPQALQDMEEARTTSLDQLHRERDKLRQEELVKQQEKKKAKEEDAAKKAKVAAQKTRDAAKKAKLREDYLKVDRHDWDKKDFGSLAKRLEKNHRVNIQEFVTRIPFPQT